MTKSWLISIVAALASALGVASAPAEEPGLTPATNKAGRQRMLSQRITKAYCQVALGVLPETSARIQQESAALFEAQLDELSALAPSKPIRESVAALADPWQVLKANAALPATPQRCVQLSAQSDAVLAAAQRLTVQLQDYSGTPVARLVNVSGRQRMLSQRLAKLYMVRATGVPE